LVFLRRLAQAVREYRAGREQLGEYVAVLAHTNNASGLYLRALARPKQAA
jgi:hypothetical protein